MWNHLSTYCRQPSCLWAVSQRFRSFMKMSIVNIKMHGWKWNGFKIQNEIKISARGKHCNQNKVVLSLLSSRHAPPERCWRVAAGTLIKRGCWISSPPCLKGMASPTLHRQSMLSVVWSASRQHYGYLGIFLSQANFQSHWGLGESMFPFLLVKSLKEKMFLPSSALVHWAQAM